MDEQASAVAPATSNPPQPAGPSGYQPVASYLHTGLIVILMAAVSYLSARTMELRAAAHDVRGPLGQYISTMVWLWSLALLVYLGMRIKKTPISEVVGGRWNTFDAFLIDLAVAGGFWLAAILALSLLATALDPARLKAATSGTLPESVKSLAPLIPHTKIEIAVWILMSTSAGICEEFVFRGYLQRQFSALTRNAALGIVLSAMCFGMAHLYQGGKQMIIIGIFGAMFGTLAYFRKSIRAGMIAHAWNDIFDGLVLSLLSRMIK